MYELFVTIDGTPLTQRQVQNRVAHYGVKSSTAWKALEQKDEKAEDQRKMIDKLRKL